jgi:hypothetical protein
VGKSQPRGRGNHHPRYAASIATLCALRGWREPETEVRFHATRKWRFDFAWRHKGVAVEVNGGAFVGGRHTRGMGAVKDWEKLNAAQLVGWKVFQVTPQQITNGTLEQILEAVL